MKLVKKLPLVLMIVAAVTIGVLAAGGTESDPLVTLSYLQNTYTKELLSKADELLLKRNEEMEAALGGSGQDASVYHVVTLTKGQTLWGEVGTEVMLRIGEAMLYAETSPGLINTTTGEALAGGGALQTNHLYMMTIEGRGIQPLTDTVKVLVRGAYTISQ